MKTSKHLCYVPLPSLRRVAPLSRHTHKHTFLEKARPQDGSSHTKRLGPAIVRTGGSSYISWRLLNMGRSDSLWLGAAATVPAPYG